MPSTISMYWREQMLQRVFRGQPIDTTLWVCLTNTVAPANSDGDSLVEPPANFGYSRKSLNLTSTAWEVNGTEVTITSEIPFGAPTGHWGLVQGWAMTTDQVGGELVASGSLVVPRRISFGTVVSIKRRSITFSLGDASA